MTGKPLFLLLALIAVAGAHVFPQHRLDQAFWKTRWDAQKTAAEAGGHDILFIGDSITQGFEDSGKAVWGKYYSPRKSLNFGISGDRTEHVIWRLKRLDWSNVKPKVAVIHIGSNDTGQKLAPAEDTAAGILTIIETVRAQSPDTEILLLGLFPRSYAAYAIDRQRNQEVNQLLTHLEGSPKLTYLDITDAFLTDKGILSTDLFPDGLHLSPAAYQIWATEMEPTLAELLK